MQFKFPHDQIASPSAQAEVAADQMAKAVEAWTNWDFERFGYELGQMFRNLVVLTLPQKYSGRHFKNEELGPTQVAQAPNKNLS